MAKNKISEYSTTAGANTDISGINIDEGCPPANMNNAIRSLMAALKGWQGGTVSGDVLQVAGGGTGSSTATGTGSVVLATSPTIATPTISSPTLTGTPTAPTAGTGTNTTQVATTAFVINQVAASAAGVSTFSGGSTGLTPSSATSGAVTLGGTLSVSNGGTGATSLAAAGITTLSGTQTITGAKTFSGATTVTGAFGVGSANPASGFWAGYARSLSATNPAFVMDGTTASGAICSAYFGGSSGNTVLFGQFLYGSQLSNTVVGNISSTGTSTSYNTSSDRRLKKDITPMTDGLEKTMLLKPVDYVWKINDEPSQGFIADELQEVIPEAVTGEPNGVNPDGTPKYQGIDTSFIVATLTSAIQQQQAIIEDLTSRIATLEAK